MYQEIQLESNPPLKKKAAIYMLLDRSEFGAFDHLTVLNGKVAELHGHNSRAFEQNSADLFR